LIDAINQIISQNILSQNERSSLIEALVEMSNGKSNGWKRSMEEGSGRERKG
jgi:hypothetical protein